MNSKGNIVHGTVARNARRTRAIKVAAAAVVSCLLLVLVHSLITMPSNLQYGLMIDAGSTGSRMHTFSFKRSGGTLKLINEDFLAVKPGLSSYKDDPKGAAKSLDRLVQRSKTIVPKALYKSTPVFLRATAGLRLVGAEAADSILREVRTYLAASGFRFDSPSWARVLGGNDEGIYSWITVNYLLDRGARNTVGTLEMGGGSAQVAFVPRKAAQGANCTAPMEAVEYRGDKLRLYTTSHLQFGLQKARQLALQHFESNGLLDDNPCINKGGKVQVDMPFDEAKRSVKMTGAGDFAACRSKIRTILINPVTNLCGCNFCTYRGSSQPPPIKEYVAFAFYLERTVALGMRTPLTVTDIRTKGEEICAMSLDKVQRTYPNVPNGKAIDLCFDLAYICAHLEYGHGISESLNAKLNIVDRINNVELGWSLGAMFAEMSSLSTKS